MIQHADRYLDVVSQFSQLGTKVKIILQIHIYVKDAFVSLG